MPTADCAMHLYDDHGREAYALALMLCGDVDAAELLLFELFCDPLLHKTFEISSNRHGDRTALMIEVVRAHQELVLNASR